MYDAFADSYDDLYPVTEDIPFYVDLAQQASGPILELAVGTGRVAIPVARATARTVIGIDTSAAMLARAVEAAEASGVSLDLRQEDMRAFELAAPAELIYCSARALFHLPTWSDRRRTFERVVEALQPGGRFAWNVFAFDHHIAAGLDGRRQDEPVTHTLRYDVADNRIDIVLESGDKISSWWTTKNEWLGLIDVAGLELEALYGSFDREPLDGESREYVFVTRRP